MSYNSKFFVQCDDAGTFKLIGKRFKFLYTFQASFTFMKGPFYYATDLPWYEMEEELTEASKRYGTEITVTRFGEDADDIWRYVFNNGVMKKAQAKLVFEGL